MERMVLLLLFTKLSYSYLVFEKFDKVENPEYLASNITIINTPHESFLSLGCDIFKALPGKILIKIDSYTKPTNGKMKLFFKTPELSFCTVLKNAKLIPFFELFLEGIKKFGNFPVECPIPTGHFVLRNLSFAGNLPVPRNVLHFFRIKGTDGSRKVARSIVKYEVYMKFV